MGTISWSLEMKNARAMIFILGHEKIEFVEFHKKYRKIIKIMTPFL